MVDNVDIPVLDGSPAILRTLHSDHQTAEDQEEHSEREHDSVDGQIADPVLAVYLRTEWHVFHVRLDPIGGHNPADQSGQEEHQSVHNASGRRVAARRTA